MHKYLLQNGFGNQAPSLKLFPGVCFWHKECSLPCVLHRASISENVKPLAAPARTGHCDPRPVAHSQPGCEVSGWGQSALTFSASLVLTSPQATWAHGWSVKEVMSWSPPCSVLYSLNSEYPRRGFQPCSGYTGVQSKAKASGRPVPSPPSSRT